MVLDPTPRALNVHRCELRLAHNENLDSAPYAKERFDSASILNFAF
jgi:hypothetical protein